MSAAFAGLRLAGSTFGRQCIPKQHLSQRCFSNGAFFTRKFPKSPTLLARRQFTFTSKNPILETAGAGTKVAESPLGGLADGFAAGKQALKDAAHVKRRSFFPETSSKAVGYWLIGSAGLVFGIVVLGGLTRLTESGYVTSAIHRPYTFKETLSNIRRIVFQLQNGSRSPVLFPH